MQLGSTNCISRNLNPMQRGISLDPGNKFQCYRMQGMWQDCKSFKSKVAASNKSQCNREMHGKPNRCICCQWEVESNTKGYQF